MTRILVQATVTVVQANVASMLQGTGPLISIGYSTSAREYRSFASNESGYSTRASEARVEYEARV